MLFTRCPECETTFRVTDETLKKANGQVRCGRCASVFNAYAELQDQTGKNLEAETERPRPRAPEPEAPGPPAAPPAAPVPVEPVAATTAAAAPPESNPDAQDAASEAAGDAPDGDLSAKEIERVLTSDAGPPLSQSAYVWSTVAPAARRPASRAWSVAVALALVALATQAVHYFRADIASHPTFGPWLERAYAAIGRELAPSWNVHQYQIIDWVATAEPNARGVGSLKITARIQNRGAQRQPYPAVQLRLKDRYEEAVGSRLFTPAEYLPRDMPRGRLMSPGETARAEIEVVDPGPDAYGFELDVCIEVEASLVTCGNDEVFL